MKITYCRIKGKTESKELLKTETQIIYFVPDDKELILDIFRNGSLSSVPVNKGSHGDSDYMICRINYSIDIGLNCIRFNSVQFGVDFHGENPILDIMGSELEQWLYIKKVAFNEYEIDREKSAKDYPFNDLIDDFKLQIYKSVR